MLCRYGAKKGCLCVDFPSTRYWQRCEPCKKVHAKKKTAVERERCREKALATDSSRQTADCISRHQLWGGREPFWWTGARARTNPTWQKSARVEPTQQY
jgi:hypothetical protein